MKKINNIALNILSRFILLIVGLYLIIFNQKVVLHISFLVGIPMLLAGIILFIESFLYYKERNFSFNNDNILPDSYNSLIVRGLAFSIVGIVILIKSSDSLSLIGISWGLFGIFKGGRNLSYFIYCIL